MSTQFPISQLEEKSNIIKEDLKEFYEKASKIVIKSSDDLNEASNHLGGIKIRLKRLEEMRKFDVGPLTDHVRNLNNKYKAQVEPLENLEKIIKSAIKVFMDEEDRKAREEAMRIRMEQEKKEREERRKMEEARQKQEEERQKELAAIRAAEEAKTKKAREAAQKLAAEAREKAEAEAIKVANAQSELDNTEIQTIDEPKKSIRSDAGLVTRKLNWAWKVENEELLRSKHPELFIVDEKGINKLIKDGARTIEGLSIFQESSISMKQ